MEYVTRCQLLNPHHSIDALFSSFCDFSSSLSNASVESPRVDLPLILMAGATLALLSCWDDDLLVSTTSVSLGGTIEVGGLPFSRCSGLSPFCTFIFSKLSSWTKRLDFSKIGRLLPTTSTESCCWLFDWDCCCVSSTSSSMGLASGLDGGDLGDGRRVPRIDVDTAVVVVAVVDDVAPAGFLAHVFPLDTAADEVQPLALSLLPPSSLVNNEDLSEMSDPPLSLSRSSDDVNLREALGDAGGGRRLQTWTWINSQSRRKRRRFPINAIGTLSSKDTFQQYTVCVWLSATLCFYYLQSKQTSRHKECRFLRNVPPWFRADQLQQYRRWIGHGAGTLPVRKYRDGILLWTTWDWQRCDSNLQSISSTQSQSHVIINQRLFVVVLHGYYKLTDRKAWIRSALTEANGFPLTSIV